MRFFLVWILLLQSAAVQAEDCLSQDKLTQLEGGEMAYMLGRIPPAFRHSVEGRKISLLMQLDGSLSDGMCKVKETLTLPQEEIAEAEQVLERDPAKRILLFSQGYSLPSSSTLEARFRVDTNTMEVAHQDTLQVGDLGKLRASVEMMYAMLSQSRAGNQETIGEIKPWSPEFKIKINQACQTRFRSGDNLAQACECRSRELAQRYSERTLDYLDYVLSNPYAKATGAAEDYSKQRGLINARCVLEPI